MDLDPVDHLEWEDETAGILITPDGTRVSTAPSYSPDLPNVSITPPVPGFAFFYTLNNDRVPVLLSGIPDSVWRNMTPAQFNEADLGKRVPVSAAMKTTGAFALVVAVGIVLYLWKGK